VRDEVVVLLSKLEDSLFIDGQLHEISTNQFKSDVFPRGYEYLTAFEQEPFVKFTYNINGRILQKTIFMLKEQSVLVVNYELKNHGQPIDLIVKPYMTARKNNEISTGIKGYNTDSYIGHDFIRWVPRAGLPELYAYFKQGEYQKATLWYQNFEYYMDKYKYSNWNEDLFNPGFFQVSLKPYESFTMFFSTEELNSFSFDYEYIYRQEFIKREKFAKVDVFNTREIQDIYCKLNGSVYYTRNETRIISSTINHYLSISDMLLSVPGTVFVNKNYDTFKELVRSLIGRLDNGILPAFYDQPLIKENDFRADLTLWLIELLYRYHLLTDDITFIEDELFDVLQAVINSYKKNKKFALRADSSNLLLAGSPSGDSNWVKLRDDNGQVIRYGKLLELNALWYNAMMIMNQFSLKLGKKRDAAKYEKYADKIKDNFIKEFFIEDIGIFYDFMNERESSKSLRINQLIPLALSFTMLSDEQGGRVLEHIDKELLTPYGLRSLSKDDENYISGRGKSVFSKSAAYYNGAILPFTIGLYVQAALRFKGNDFVAEDLWKYFKLLLSVKDQGLLGYFPDFLIEDSENECCQFDDFTLSSASIIWAYYLLFRDPAG
jgi:predicted glycogen debranching enzyme